MNNNVVNSTIPRSKGVVRKKKIKTLSIIGLFLGVVIIVIGIINIKRSVVTSTYFEEKGNLYVLKDQNGNVLIDNIKNKGYFCNGSTYVVKDDGKEALISNKGEYITEFGKYQYIEQEGCFYKVTSTSGAKNMAILKSDGSILIDNGEDKYLKNTHITSYYTCFSDMCSGSLKYALLEKKDEYIVLNSNGEALLKLNKVEELTPELNVEYKGSSDRYLSVFFNDKTYIIDLNSSQKILEFKDKLYISSVNINNSDQFILQKYSYEDEKALTKFINKNKVTFETDVCFDATFAEDNIQCLVSSDKGDKYKYYDMNGQELNSVSN